MGVAPEENGMDYLVLELRGGYPLLRVNLGTGEGRAVIDGKDGEGVVKVNKLSDGQWHRIDIYITANVSGEFMSMSYFANN